VVFPYVGGFYITGTSFQNQGEFWKLGGVSKTGRGFQNRYQFPKPGINPKIPMRTKPKFLSREKAWLYNNYRKAITPNKTGIT
jgi:hypothetical protein